MKIQAYSNLFNGIANVLDVILIVLIYPTFTNDWLKDNPEIGAINKPIVMSIILGWLILDNIFNINQFGKEFDHVRTLRNLVLIYIPFVLLTWVYMHFVAIYREIPWPALTAITVFVGTAFFGRLVLNKIYVDLNRRTTFRKRAVIVGLTRNGKKLFGHFAENRYLGIDCLGFFDDTQPVAAHILGRTNEIQSFILANNVQFIFVVQKYHHDLIKKVSDFAKKHFLRFFLVPDLGSLEGRPMDYNVIQDLNMPILSPRREPLRFFYNLLMKRIFDIVFSSIVLVTVFPVIYIIFGLAIRLESKGPILFKQLRIGQKGRIFKCYKFRTMKLNRDADRVQASKQDTRITRIGRFLRRTSMDEFPQFINVLKGEMSIVGPRPHMLKHDEEYSKLIEDYEIRHFAPTGITGYAQINGMRGEIRHLEDLKKRVEYDNWYLNHWSLRLDFRIMFFTISKLIFSDPKAY